MGVREKQGMKKNFRVSGLELREIPLKMGAITVWFCVDGKDSVERKISLQIEERTTITGVMSHSM